MMTPMEEAVQSCVLRLQYTVGQHTVVHYTALQYSTVQCHYTLCPPCCSPRGTLR